MKYFKVLLSFFTLVALSRAHLEGEDSVSDERPEYECATVFENYYLDDAPAEHGLSAGFYAPGKKAYVGMTLFGNMTFEANRIQLDPPGAYLFGGSGPTVFSTDSRQIWYLVKKHHQRFRWIASQSGEIPAFAVKIGDDRSGFPVLVGRIQRENGLVYVGVVVPFMGVLYYVNENGVAKSAQSGYQVLTCKSCEDEPKVPSPEIPDIPCADVSKEDVGCINNWVAYDGDDAPATKGVSAGEFDCNNQAFVGKAFDGFVFTPGRIQTGAPAGIHYSNGNGDVFKASGAFYLADNPAYTYRWMPFDGSIPPNAVAVRTPPGLFKLQVGRVKDNGKMKIGKLAYPSLVVPNGDDADDYFSNFELLVCDPWPRFQCGQQWKPFDAASLPVDGFSVDGGVTFIGRGVRKCINGCDFELGSATTADGVTYLDDLTATAVNDMSGEYLVANPAYTYRWVVSRDGAQVPNALELHREGHSPFYIGIVTLNDRVFVGKVRPGQGLFFVDANGKQRTTSDYSVLTCTSSDASNGGEWKAKASRDWLGSFGCPLRMEWSYTKWRCICRDEFRGILPPSLATWNEQTCSYTSP